MRASKGKERKSSLVKNRFAVYSNKSGRFEVIIPYVRTTPEQNSHHSNWHIRRLLDTGHGGAAARRDSYE